MTKRGQLRKTAGQVGYAGALAAGGIQRNRHVFVLSQDRFDQTAQPRAGADFQKCPDTGHMHGLDFGYKFHRTRQLSRQEFLGLAFSRRIFGGSRIGKNRDVAGR